RSSFVATLRWRRTRRWGLAASRAMDNPIRSTGSTAGPQSLPVLSAEANRGIEIAQERARIDFRGAQRKCFHDDFQSGVKELDSERATSASLQFAVAVFRTKAAAYFAIRTSYDDFKGRLTLVLRETIQDLREKWKGLDGGDRATFEAVCLPAVNRSLRE